MRDHWEKDEKHKVVVCCIGGPQCSGSQGGCSLPVRATSAHYIPSFFLDHSHHNIFFVYRSSIFDPSLFSPSCSVLEIPSFLSLLLLVTRSLLKYIYVIFRLCELIKRDIWEQGRMENDPPFFWLLYRRIFLLYLFTWSFWIRLCKEKI